MIQSKKDMRAYLKADEIALGINKTSNIQRRLKLLFGGSAENIYKYQKLLRLTEYYINQKNVWILPLAQIRHVRHETWRF